MKLKIVLIILGIVLIISLAIFGPSIKEKALKGMVQNIPEYNCREEGLCTSCIIGGYTCSCGVNTCNCGNKTVDKSECELYEQRDNPSI